MTGIVSGLRGTPAWEPVEREDSSICGCTHSQVVRFVWRKMYYTATFTRFIDKNALPGKRVTYCVDAMRDSTGRRSAVLSDMVLASGWVSTFVNNVREWAEQAYPMHPANRKGN